MCSRSLLLPLLLPLLLLLLGQHTGLAVEQKCRECICKNSRGSWEDICEMPPAGSCIDQIYCGPYAISPGYWMDAGSLGGDFQGCMADWECSNRTMDNYIDRYCTVLFVGHEPPCSCEEQTKIHHCGPYDWHTQKCDDYYQWRFAPCMAE